MQPPVVVAKSPPCTSTCSAAVLSVMDSDSGSQVQMWTSSCSHTWVRRGPAEHEDHSGHSCQCLLSAVSMFGSCPALLLWRNQENPSEGEGSSVLPTLAGATCALGPGVAVDGKAHPQHLQPGAGPGAGRKESLLSLP